MLLMVLGVLSVLVLVSVFRPGKAEAFNLGYHYELIRESMVQEGFNKDAYSVALAGNSYTDLFQPDETSWAIDNKFCEEAQNLVKCLHFDQLLNQDMIERYWRTLIQNTYNAVVAKVNSNDQLGLLMVMGVSLHIVADFYAHSNWSELDLPSYTHVKDVTFFEVIRNYANELSEAIRVNDNMPCHRYDYEYGLFTHGDSGGTLYRPNHDLLHKDHAARPHFDWSYRAAYKASLQWIRLIRKWVSEDLHRPDFWNSVIAYDYPYNQDYLYTLTNFDEGTIRWLCTYGGAWKMPERWGKVDISSDDMPNVPGIGVTEQVSQDYPYLGIEWFANCALVAVGLFEATGSDKVRKLSEVKNLREALNGSSEDFEDTVEAKISTDVNLSSIEWINNSIVNNAITFMANTLSQSYNQVRWIRICIPKAKDLDTGDDYFGVNDEEIGGTSDFWVLFKVGDLEYSEAEYVDQSSPDTLWGVLKPVWDTLPVDITVKMYESDPSDHKDEKMDIRPGSGKDLTFTFHPDTETISDLPEDCSMYSIPNGYYISSSGSGGLKARVYLKVWKMSDSKVEFIGNTIGQDNGETDALVWGHVSSRMWPLERVHHNDHDGSRTDIYTFDPGSGWSPERLTSFKLHKNKDDNWHVGDFYVKSGTHWRGGNANSLLTNANLTYDFGGYASHLTSADVESRAQYFTVITKTLDDVNCQTDDDVYISFLDNYDGVLAKYKLCNFDKKSFQRGQYDYFWLREQYNLGGYSYLNTNLFTIKKIAKIRIEKPGTDNWIMEKLEVWVNDKILYQDSPNFRFADETNPKTLTWETEVVIPKNVYFDEDALVSSQGIIPIGGSGDKGHAYMVEAKVKLEGYNSVPEISWDFHPKTPYAQIFSIQRSSVYSKIKMYVYMNDDWNLNSMYTLRVEVKSGNVIKSSFLWFMIPTPSVQLRELAFGGGNQIIECNGKKVLRYIGTYKYEFQNFAADSVDLLSTNWQFDRDKIKVLSQNGSEIQLIFDVPPAEGSYNINLLVSDRDNVQKVGDKVSVVIPEIRCNFSIKHLLKRSSYFYLGRVKSLPKDKSATKPISRNVIQPMIQAVSVNDSNFKMFENNFKEIVTLFKTVQVTAKPFMTRNGVIYQDHLQKPTYKWRVRTALKELTFTHPKKHILRPGDRIPGRSLLPQVGSKAARDKYIRVEEELKHIINIDTSGVRLNEKIFITCEITDGVGQKATFTHVTTANLGYYPWVIIEFNLESVLRSLYMKNPILKDLPFSIRNPFPGPEKTLFKKLSQKEKDILKLWNVLRDQYLELANKNLDNFEVPDSLLRINEKLMKDFVQILK